MKILVIGSGGRENAIVSAIKKSKKNTEIFCAPGNGGTAEIAANVPLKQDDIKGLLSFALENKIDLTVVGPEIPLSLGIADEFTAAGLKIFGPTGKHPCWSRQKNSLRIFSKNIILKLPDTNRSRIFKPPKITPDKKSIR
jgi:Phosphoribosylamine-glycine ligase